MKNKFNIVNDLLQNLKWTILSIKQAKRRWLYSFFVFVLFFFAKEEAHDTSGFEPGYERIVPKGCDIVKTQRHKY